MRNVYRLLICLVGFLVSLHFSVYGQQYTLTPSAGNFVPLVGGIPLDAIEANEGVSPAINIGFTFNYFGAPYNQLRVSAKGYLSFNAFIFNNGNNAIGQNGFENRIVAPLWDNLSGFGGQASYKVTGDPIDPDQVFTLECLNWRWNYASGAAISFQVSLYESTGEIRFVYKQEAGALFEPSASIGIVGPQASQFYSLVFTDPSNPQFAPTGYNFISQAPATGQIYSFMPSLIVPVVPGNQSSNIAQTQLTATSMNIDWVVGDGAYRVVFVKQTSLAENFVASDNQFYNASSSFGNAPVGDGWSCVYNGTGSSALITNLRPGFIYRIQVIEYNGLAAQQKYLSSPSNLNPISHTVPLVRPGDPASTLSINYVSDNLVRFELLEGNGTFRAVFLKEGDNGLAPAVDNFTYTANTIFGSGSQIENSGWYCVYNGANTSNIIATNLQPGSTYKIHVVDYNGPVGNEFYNTSSESATGNFQTVLSTTTTYDFSASIGNFLPIVNGTVVPELHTDDAFSSTALPIGFTFYFNGTAFNEVIASSNGFITFNHYAHAFGADSYTNDLTGSYLRPLVAPLWDDLNGFGGTASYSTTGDAPYRVFTMEYLNFKWYYNAANAGISFQIKLHESGNSIELIYRQEPGALLAPSASIGLAFLQLDDFISLDGTGINPGISTTSETANIVDKPATDQIFSFAPPKQGQTITFNELPATAVGNAIQLAASATSGLPIAYSSSDPSVASITGSTIIPHRVGEVTITAMQVGNAVFNSAANVQQLLTVNKGNQTIPFPVIASKKYGDVGFSLNAFSSSDLTIVYESSDPSVATISNNQVTIVGVGTTTITAKQSGNENYTAAADVQRTLIVAKGEQQITFNSLPEKNVGDNAFDISASSSVGLPVSFTSSNSAIATVTGNTITIVGHGIVTITASQTGNANYNAATPIEQTFKVRSNQTITFAEISTKKLGDPNFTLTPTASSGLAVQLSTQSDKINLTNGTVSITSPGVVKITANQSGDEIFFAAPPVERTFCVSPLKPTITTNGLGSESPVLQSSSPSNNQWFKDGVLLSGQNGSSLTAGGAGMYTVKVIVEGCASEASDSESLIVTGLNIEQDQIRLFPNPARDRITVDVRTLNLQREVPVTVIDLSGKEVLRSSVQKSVELDIAKLRAGNYQILIKHGSRAISKEFVKH